MSEGDITRRDFLKMAATVPFWDWDLLLPKIAEKKLHVITELVSDDPRGIGEPSAVVLSDGTAVVCQKRSIFSREANNDFLDNRHNDDTVDVYIRGGNGTWNQKDVRSLIPYRGSMRLTDPVLVAAGGRVDMVVMASRDTGDKISPDDWKNFSGIWYLRDVGETFGYPTVTLLTKGSAIFLQSDGPTQWYNMPHFPHIAMDPTNHNRMCIIMQNLSQHRLSAVLSNDGGGSWTEPFDLISNVTTDANGNQTAVKEFNVVNPTAFYTINGKLGVVYTDFTTGNLRVTRKVGDGVFPPVDINKQGELTLTAEAFVFPNSSQVCMMPDIRTSLPAGTILVCHIAQIGASSFQPVLHISADHAHSFSEFGTVRLKSYETAALPAFHSIEGYGPVLGFYILDENSHSVRYSVFDFQTGKIRDASPRTSSSLTRDQFLRTNGQPFKRTFGDYAYGGAFNLPTDDGNNLYIIRMDVM